ncbi:helix-turn-helix domain-containing protein [Rhizobium sp. YAF28]|uniref:helix-turn-helix domain-containing protein n=1 Tax=Rhizobium sp. YAF28 TaxID=3233081 RepID=UPI003F9451D7
MIAARQFTSAAEMRAHYAAVHQRCFNPVVVPPEPVVIEAAGRFVTKKVPLWLVKDIHFDAHLVEWRDRVGNRPFAYLKDRCRELDVLYRDMIGPDRRRPTVQVRQQLIWELHHKFGMSFPALGRLFGGRDHTTMLHSVRRVEAKRGEA